MNSNRFERLAMSARTPRLMRWLMGAGLTLLMLIGIALLVLLTTMTMPIRAAIIKLRQFIYSPTLTIPTDVRAVMAGAYISLAWAGGNAKRPTVTARAI